MRDFRRLASLGLIMAALAAPLVPTLGARTRKGDSFLEKGREAEARKEWETALEFYEQAVLEDPADAAYQLATRRVRFQAAMQKIETGQKLRQEGKLEEALASFQRAYAIDPSIYMAEQELKLTLQMIAREKAAPSATPEDRGLTPLEKMQREADEKAERMLPVPELRPLQRQISTLKMNNQPVKVLYETLGKLAGINVIFDSEYQTPPQNRFTIDLSNTTLEEALDYLAIQTKSYWKPLSPNTIFVTNDNVTKRRDYEEYVVKVFYVKNATTVQELQEIATTVRSVTEIRRAFTYNAQMALLVRGTADQVALAEKLIQDLDKPKAEVVIDVIVMEANRGRTRDLAAALTTGGAAGINVPISYNRTTTTTGTGDGGTGNGGGSTTTSSAIPLNRIGSLGTGDFSITAPGALIQALLSDSTTRIMQSPQVRVVENQKGSLKIGDRIPYATGSFQPGVGGVGLNPLVSTQFQFLDTGVNVDITPKVHGRDEISMQVEVDVSAKSGEVELGGLRQPTVSRRTVNLSIRVKEGEVSILGGLLGTQQNRIRNGIPLLMDVPVLGRLFGSEKVENNRGELLMVLIPRIVRAPDFTEANLRGVSAGNDQNVKLNYAPRANPAPEAGPAQAAPPAPGTADAVTPPPAPAEERPAPASAAPRMSFAPAPTTAAPGSPVVLSLHLDNAKDLFSAPLKLRYDPKILRLNSVQPGALLTSDGQAVNFSESTVNESGEAIITLNRLPGSGGVTGSGALLQLTFQTIAPGSAKIEVVDPGLRDTQLQPVNAGAPSTTVVVQ